MTRRSCRAALAALAGFSLLAGACGSGTGDDQAATDNAVDKIAEAATSTTAAGSTDTTVAPVPTSMEEWEKLWAAERAAVVEKITEGSFGKSADGKSLTGPGDFKLDLSKCASGWSDTEGLSDTEIKIGQTISQSGTTADYGYITKAMLPMFEYYNGKGAFKDANGKDRKIVYIAKDDGYDPARTIPLVDELIDSDKVFTMWTLGTANTLKTYDKLNSRCIPQVLAMTGHPAWGDPVNHPWTTGMQMAYNTEAVLWGGFINQRLSEFPADRKVRVGALLMNNDFGKSYDAAFRAYWAKSPNKDRIEYYTEVIETQVPSITDAMTTIASKQPDVFIVMSTGVPCTQSVTESAQNGMKDSVKYKFMSSVCKGSGFIGKDKVGGDGSATDGWWVVGGGAKDLQSTAYDGDVWIKWARDTMGAKGQDYKESGSLGSGVYFGWSMIQALQIAGQLPGGLTRSNLVLAVRSMDMTHPFLLPGVKFNMNGTKDAYLVEGSEFGKYDYKIQNWVPQGDIIDLSGASPLCPWDQSTGTCKA